MVLRFGRCCLSFSFFLLATYGFATDYRVVDVHLSSMNYFCSPQYGNSRTIRTSIPKGQGAVNMVSTVMELVNEHCDVAGLQNEGYDPSSKFWEYNPDTESNYVSAYVIPYPNRWIFYVNYVAVSNVTCAEGEISDSSGACVPDPELQTCESMAGQVVPLAFFNSSFSMPSFMCAPVGSSSCSVQSAGIGVCTSSGECFGTYVHMGSVCSASELEGSNELIETQVTEECSQKLESGFCLDENGDTSIVDSNLTEYTPEPGQVCAEHNGAVVCSQPQDFEQNCGYFNGEQLCVNSEGEPVDPTDPDHPNNGGNLDGSSNNDPLDPADPSDSLTANEQRGVDLAPVTGAIQEQTSQLLDQGQTGLDQDKAFYDAVTEVIDAESSITYDGAEPFSDVESTSSAAGEAIRTAVNQSQLGQIANSFKGMFDDSGTCPALSIDLSDQGFGAHSYNGHCEVLDNTRVIFQAVFFIFWSFMGFRVFASA